MENKLFEQMQNIIKNESLHGTIVLLDNKEDRGIGKTSSISMLADIYQLKVGKKHNYPECGIKLNTNEDYYAGKIYNSEDMYILDEGFTLNEVNILKKYYNIIFALVNVNQLNGFVMVEK
jgi:hypothetical protein